MAGPLDRITDRSASLHSILAAIEVNRDSLAKRIGKFLEPALRPGEEMPDLAFLLELFGRALRRLFDKLLNTEKASLAARKEEEKLRAERGRLTKALYQKVVHVRGIIRKLFGRRHVPALTGTEGETATVTLDLLNQAWVMEATLSDPGLKLPPPLIPVGELDPKRWVKLFKDESADLTRIDKKVSELRRATQSAVLDKDHAFEGYNDGFVKVCDALAAFFRLAGMPDIARTVAPSKQTPGLTLVEARSRRKAAATRRAKEDEAGVEPEETTPKSEPPGPPGTEPT